MHNIHRRDFVFGLAAASVVGAAGEDDGWVRLGTATMRRSSLQSVEIRVDPSIRLLSQLRLRVRKSDAVSLRVVRMRDLTVTFGDGAQTSLSIKSDIALGETTRALDLPGRVRTVRRVRLHYQLFSGRRVLPQRTRGTVELWGRKRPADAAPQP
jgi:hypothetical protein